MSTVNNETVTADISEQEFLPQKSEIRLCTIYEMGKLQREAGFKYSNPYSPEADEFKAYRTGYEHGKLDISLPDASQLAMLDCSIIKELLKPLMYNDFKIIRLGRDLIMFFGEGTDIMTLDNALNELYPNNNRTVFKDDNVETQHYQLSFYFDVAVGLSEK
tara:strand:+ start:5174 stop:5656 length:483 start_codon:yes stop_codon:yes gene_type:complete